MSTTNRKNSRKSENTSVIQFRGPHGLEKKLRAIAPKKRLTFSEFMRAELWAVVAREERAAGSGVK